MRKQFIEILTDIASKDDRIWLLTADMGFGVVEPFAEVHPNRFVNVGVAEQNMIGIAMGLASSGAFPFCYSIATFLTMRPYEFIRHACYQKLPIRIVGTGRGKEYRENGFTHWALEDRRAMGILPNLKIIVPRTVADAVAELRQTWCLKQGIYYSLSRG